MDLTVQHAADATPALSMKDKVVELQNFSLKFPQVEVVTEHTFKPGVYERKITIPPWTLLTGAEHKTPYRVRLEKGRIAVNTDEDVKLLEAPCEFDVPTGAQRAGCVFDDEVVWVDVYDNPDDCTDLAVLEDRLYFVPEYGLAATRTAEQKARLDYNIFVNQLGVSQDDIDAIVHNTSDLIDMPEGVAVELRDSPIHGKGLFAARDYSAGEVVCPGRLDGKRTPGGRFINHSPEYNVIPEKVGDDIYVIAAKHIAAGSELLIDYRASIQVNLGLLLEGAE